MRSPQTIAAVPKKIVETFKEGKLQKTLRVHGGAYACARVCMGEKLLLWDAYVSAIRERERESCAAICRKKKECRREKDAGGRSWLNALLCNENHI